MGRTLTAFCKCGFSKELLEGRGKLSPTTYTPSYCIDCDESFSVVDDKRKCPNCGSNNIFPFKALTSPKPEKEKGSFKRILGGFFGKKQVVLDIDSLVTDTPIYLCPKCKEYKLSFIISILWD